MILRHTYTRSRDRARAALRYYETRPRGNDEPPRAIFTATGTATRAEAYRLLDSHQTTWFLAHRLMLSPSRVEHPEDLQALTRYVLRELEKEKGLALHWVAVEHRNTDHPHVHVVLCGGGGIGSVSLEDVRLDQTDHARIKDDGITYCRTEEQDRERWASALIRAAVDDRDREATRDGWDSPAR